MNLRPVDENPAWGRRREAPFITFGVPAYNRPHLLRETLTSLAAQTGSHDFEVVVCDDGGLAETAAAVQEQTADRFCLYRNPAPLGGVGNWNRCLQQARGQWIMILHDDDLLFPWYLNVVTPRLHEGLGALGTLVAQGATPPILPPFTGEPAIRSYPPLYFLKSSFTPFPGVLFPRELGLQLGGFDPRWGPLADYEFWYRLAAAGPVEVVRAIAAFYRVSPGQWTESQWPTMLRRMHLLRLRVAREQWPGRPRRGRWFARFFTYRSARAYARRFAQRPAGLTRALAFGRIPGARLPSGWVWRLLQFLA